MGRLVLFAIYLLPVGAISGAVPERILPIQSHDVWDSASGFPGGYVYSINQTGDGYLWIGTSRGLVRFDGLKFAHISEANFPVLGLVRDSTGQLWAIDERTHLYRYADGRLVGPLPDNGQHKHRAASIATTSRGEPLIASPLQGVVEYQRGAPEVVLGPDAIPGWPTAVAQTSDGVFWIGTRDTGVFRLSVHRGIPEIEHVAGMPYAKINSLLPIGDSTLLAGTSQGLVSLHKGMLIQQTRPELNGQDILALARGRAGEVWIGANGRLFKAEANQIEADGKIHSLDHMTGHSTVTSLFEDRDGSLWIGGPDRIERYRGDEFNTYSTSSGLPASNSGAIYVDEQGSAWFAPWDGRLFRISNGLVEPITEAGLNDDTVYSIAGSAGELWVARKYGGVTRLRPQGSALQSVTYTRRDGLAQDSVYSIYIAPDGTVWAGTLNGGLSRFRSNAWQTFTTRDGLPSNTVSAITGNAAGEVFVGTPNGLAELRKDGGWVTYTTRDGLPPGAIESLFLDSAGTLWIGTAKGISFLQSGTIHVPLSAPDPLYGEILGMAENNGSLWITTGNHVLRVKCRALLNDKFEAGDYREFGVADGLASVEGVKRSRSVVKDNRGRIWFSLNQSISVLQPSAFTTSAFPVAIRLDGVLVDGKLIQPGAHIHLSSGQRRLTFRYAGVSVSNPEGVRYRYLLDNVDSGWSEPTAMREVDYTNVPPGHFQFHVIASNPDGVWSAHEATMAFDIDPAFWQNRKYRLVSLAALLLFMWGLYRLRLRQITAKAELRHRERLAERTRIARELHDTMLQSFQGLMLRLQSVEDLLPPGKAKDQLERSLERADQAIAEGRRAVHDLRSSTMTNNDLADALRVAANELMGDRSVTFRLVVEGAARKLHPILRDEVYRIACEALRNAFNHAQANLVEAEITYGDGLLRLRIRDNGSGIPKHIIESGRAGHYGLSGMRERAQQSGAKLVIWTGSGTGTEIDLSIPASIAYAKPRRVAWRLFHRKVGPER